LYNFCKRLEYAINKFFGATKNGHWYRKSIPERENEDLLPPYNYVSYSYNKKEPENSTIYFILHTYNIDKNKVDIIKKELKNLKVKNFISYDLTINQAEKFLEAFKSKKLYNDLIDIDANKFNL
jgi:hypothetical protein